jgi:two-component sensor histidine kinase
MSKSPDLRKTTSLVRKDRGGSCFVLIDEMEVGVQSAESSGPKATTLYRQFLFAVLLLSVLTIVAFSVTLYFEKRGALMEGIDEKLRTAATMARATLPADYHDRIVGPGSVSDAEFQVIVGRYNALCETLGMEYLWSLMDIDGMIVFTSATSPDKEVKNRKHAGFFEKHSNPELYTKTFATMEPSYQINDDRWGRIRVALLPFRDSHGRPYLFGASVRLTDVDEQMQRVLWRSLLIGLGVLLGAIGVGVLQAKIILRPITHLTETIRGIAEGDAGLVAEERGTYEQIVLAGSFNHLNRALQARIIERTLAEERIRRSLEEKEVLLREVHHRVKNNLNVISSLLSLQSSAIQTPEEAIAAFLNSRDRVKAMALVHKELYESEDYGCVDMNEYLGKLTEHLFAVYGSSGDIRVNSQAEGILLGVDTSIPCGLILNELITNAFKHAFPNGGPGEIRVLLRAVGSESFELSVADDGIGMAEDYAKSETMGLTLVRLLTEQLEGTMELSGENGTRCVIGFPLRRVHE